MDVHDLLVTLRHSSQQRLVRNTRDRRRDEAVEHLRFQRVVFEAASTAQIFHQLRCMKNLNFRPLREATFMHRRPEELHCKKEPRC